MATLSDERSVALGLAIDRAFAALDAAGASWCVLRGEDRLDRPGSDVDLLVAPAGFPAAARALARAGFAPLPLRSSHRLFAAYEPRTDAWLKLDIVTALAYGRPPTVRVQAVDACLALRTFVDGVPLLMPDDRFWSELMHVVLDREDVPEETRRRLVETAEQIEPERGPFAAALAAELGHDTVEQLSTLVRNDAWDEIRAALADVAPRGSRSRSRRTMRLRRLLSRAGRNGVSVALLGPDGAGKSTLAAGLGESVPLTTRCLYMGMQPGASVPGKTWTASSTGPRKRRPLPARLLRQSRRLLRFARRSALAWVLVHTGHLVIFDRFPYDAEVHWANVSSAGARLRLALLRRVVIRPDVVVLLDVPGTITFERKGEHSPELLELRRERYLELATRLEHAHVIDATRRPGEVRSMVTSLVWRAYANKHAGRGAP